MEKEVRYRIRAKGKDSKGNKRYILEKIEGSKITGKSINPEELWMDMVDTIECPNSEIKEEDIKN